MKKKCLLVILALSMVMSAGCGKAETASSSEVAENTFDTEAEVFGSDSVPVEAPVV